MHFSKYDIHNTINYEDKAHTIIYTFIIIFHIQTV